MSRGARSDAQPYGRKKVRCTSKSYYRFRTKQIFGGRYVTPACRFSAPRYAVTQIFGARAAREEKIRFCDFPWKWCALRLCNVRVQVNRIIYFPNEQGISETGNEHGRNIWIVGGRANVCSCSGCTQTPLASIVRTACENFRYIYRCKSIVYVYTPGSPLRELHVKRTSPREADFGLRE